MSLIPFLLVTLLLKDTIGNLEEQLNDHLDPIQNDPDLDYHPKEQDKRTIFGGPPRGWAKHVGYGPSGNKLILGYSPVDFKYTPVIKPYLRPVKMQFNGWRPLFNKFTPHFRPISPAVRPVIPFRPSAPLGPIKDNGWKPLPSIPINVPPPQTVLKPWQSQGWNFEKPVNAGVSVGTVVSVEQQPVVPVKPVGVPTGVTHLEPVKPVHLQPAFPLSPVFPSFSPVFPAPPPVIQPAPVIPQVPFAPAAPVIPAAPVVPIQPFPPQPSIQITKPLLPVLPLGASFPSPVVHPNVIKGYQSPHVIPQQHIFHHFGHSPAPLPPPQIPAIPHATNFHHAPLPSTFFQPGPLPAIPAPPPGHPLLTKVPSVLSTGTGSLEFHGKAAHLIPLLQTGAKFLPNGLNTVHAPPAFLPSPLPAVPVNAQVPAFDLATFFQKHPGVTPIFPSNQIPINFDPHGQTNAHGPQQNPVHTVFPSNLVPAEHQNSINSVRPQFFPDPGHFIPGENLPQEPAPINHHAFPHLLEGHQQQHQQIQDTHQQISNLGIQPGQTDLQIPFHLPQHPNFRGNFELNQQQFNDIHQNQEALQHSFDDINHNFRASPSDQYLREEFTHK